MMETQIFYLLGYDVKTKKWFSADDLLGVFTDNKGPVLEGDDIEGKFRPLEDGVEKDLDFDNTEALGQFLRTQNEAQDS